MVRLGGGPGSRHDVDVENGMDPRHLGARLELSLPIKQRGPTMDIMRVGLDLANKCFIFR